MVSPASFRPPYHQNTVASEKPTVRHLRTADSREQFFEWKYCESFFDNDNQTHWWSLKSDCPAKFTLDVVEELRNFQTDFANQMRNRMKNSDQELPRYQVLSSEIPGIFNLGGDLAHFYELITAGDREGLLTYARKCIELVYLNVSAMGLPMTTIALVKGNAMGGGMEAALSCNVIVAERHVQMGLPEVLFNLFPGMGAYQFLSRRMPATQAERLILSGITYSAEDLHKMGVVDVLAETGEGEQAVRRYIRRQRTQHNANSGLRQMIQGTDPVSRESLMQAVDVWVDCAMGLGESDLTRMKYLIRSQRNRGY